jgi:hypothetical protein
MITEYLQQSYVIRHLNELKPNYCQHFPLVCILLGDQGQEMIHATSTGCFIKKPISISNLAERLKAELW